MQSSEGAAATKWLASYFTAWVQLLCWQRHSSQSMCSRVLPCWSVCICAQGGNDYEIFSSEKTVGHTVTSPDDTQKQCTELFIKQAVAA